MRVEPAAERGKVRWFGDGRALSFEICQGIKFVLAENDLKRTRLGQRADARLEQLRDEFSWLHDCEETVVLKAGDELPYWWTFAGMQANAWLSVALGDLADQSAAGDLGIRLAQGATTEALVECLAELDPAELMLGERVAQGAIDRLKFAEALPERFARMVVERRMRDDDTVQTVASWEMRFVTQSD